MKKKGGKKGGGGEVDVPRDMTADDSGEYVPVLAMEWCVRSSIFLANLCVFQCCY